MHWLLLVSRSCVIVDPSITSSFSMAFLSLFHATPQRCLLTLRDGTQIIGTLNRHLLEGPDEQRYPWYLGQDNDEALLTWGPNGNYYHYSDGPHDYDLVAIHPEDCFTLTTTDPYPTHSTLAASIDSLAEKLGVIQSQLDALKASITL